jgi:hypothetical protein
MTVASSANPEPGCLNPASPNGRVRALGRMSGSGAAGAKDAVVTVRLRWPGRMNVLIHTPDSR